MNISFVGYNIKLNFTSLLMFSDPATNVRENKLTINSKIPVQRLFELAIFISVEVICQALLRKWPLLIKCVESNVGLLIILHLHHIM